MQDVLKKYQDQQIDPKTQKRLNQPLKDPMGISPEKEEFLKMLIQKIENGELDPMNPSSLYHPEAYSKLDEADQEKADMAVINIMGVIRQIKQLWEMDQKTTFQLQNLVETVFQMKSKIESKLGDIYII